MIIITAKPMDFDSSPRTYQIGKNLENVAKILEYWANPLSIDVRLDEDKSHDHYVSQSDRVKFAKEWSPILLQYSDELMQMATEQ